jgi:hypothetical protein
MTAFAEIKKQVHSALAAALANKGFKSEKGRDRFTRKVSPDIAHRLDLILNREQTLTRLHVHISVRINTIEDIFHRTSGYEKKYQRDTPTIGGALDAIKGDPQYDMTLDAETGVERARTILTSPETLDFCGAWYQRFSQIKEIDHELNDDPYRETPNRPMLWLRCSTGIISARLVARPNFAELVQIYSQQMQTISSGFYWPRFKALLEDTQRS